MNAKTQYAAGQKVLVDSSTAAVVNHVKGRWINITEVKSGKTRNVGFKDIAPDYTKPQAAKTPADGQPVGECKVRLNGIVPAVYLNTYAKVKLADGTITRDSGDDVAVMLRGQELNEVYKMVAHKLGVTQVSLKTLYEHLNPGQQRMCLGNKLRKALRDADAAE